MILAPQQDGRAKTIAGHQRGKAARALGRETVPAWVIAGDISERDEVMFNQLHNGTDLELDDATIRVDLAGRPAPVGCFQVFPADRIRGNLRAPGAVIRNMIGELLLKYGNWGGAVLDPSGRVLSAGQYLLACHTLGMPARCWIVPADKAEETRRAFARSYGKYSYAHLPRNTYLQSMAQMYRLRGSDNTFSEEGKTSRLFELQVKPDLRPGDRVLDFGCGQADYLRELRRQNVHIIGFEPFFRKGGGIDCAAVHAMGRGLFQELTTRGRFDRVVCDSVLNSIDSQQAEHDVMVCLNAFCRPGGRIYFSGRRRDEVDAKLRMTKQVNSKTANRSRWIEFLDDDGYTGAFRNGKWFFQKFHTSEQAARLAQLLQLTDLRLTKTGGSWQVSGVKTCELPTMQTEAALRREFDLEWPVGRIGLAEPAVDAWRAAVEKERS